jgi:stage III sporulation protein AA
MRLGNEDLRLFSVLTEKEIEKIVERIFGGALYAHRDSIAEGYVSLPYGIRVGLCGRASYDGGRLVGVSDIRSLVFRIPTGGCAFSDELYDIFLGGVGSGMLIYSPPGVGKTTALRSLAYSAGRGGLHVVVVDERGEFSPEDYHDSEVDILRGYRRREGIEIATRTMSADLIIIDELSGGESGQISEVSRCGIPLVASVHASSAEEVRIKPSLVPLISCGAFEMLVGISRRGDKYTLRTDRL